jgi:hypothetical protein
VNVAVLVNPMLVRLPNGRDVNLPPGLVSFEASPEGFVVRYERGDKIVLQDAENDFGKVRWRIVAGRDAAVSLADDRRTVKLPNGSTSFDGQIRVVWQVDDTFVILVDVPGGTERFLPSVPLPRWRTPSNAIVAVDEHGNERWRRYGFDSIYDSGPGTILAKDGVARVTFDARTGAELDVQQDR